MDARKLIGILLVFLGLPVCSFGQTMVTSTDSFDIQKNLVDYGAVKIIVGLNIPFKAMGSLSNSAAIQQEAVIFNAQQALLNTLKPNNEVLQSQSYQTIPFIAMTVSGVGYQKLLTNPMVNSIQYDRPEDATLSESVPLIGGNTAWSFNFTGAGQVIAILDTGVQKTHPFIGTAKVVIEACFGTTLSSIATTFCPNANANGDSTGVNTGVNCPINIPNCSHGTHVAGIAAGNGANANQSFSGVAKEAQIAAIQVFSRIANCDPTPSPCAQAYISDQVAALEWVLNNRDNFRFAAVNMSLGGDRFTSQTNCDLVNKSRKAVIDNLRSEEIATVVISGNDGFTDSLGAPGCISSAISVGATTKADQVADFSNSASFLDLLAPGVDINSSIPNNEYASWDGTSMAAPHVAGAFALLKQADPTATVDTLLQRLKSTGNPITDRRNNITTPRINLFGALDLGPKFLPAILSIILDDDAPVSYRLTVDFSTNGGAAGTVTSTPSGINACSTSCSANFNSGARVTLTARPTSGTFGGWTGAGCSGTDNCVVTMTAAQSVIATFNGGSGEVFPPNGAWPSGWTTPTTSNANWIVANSPAAHEGSYTLRSGVIGHDQKSQVQVSRTFQAGTVRFARKVSSENGYDFLRFYVDGVKKGEWSGVQDWVVVSYPLTAGAHTLLWSYEKDDSAVAGNDVARIDSVSLPPAGGTTYALTVSKAGTGTGTVTSAPAGINCGSACSANFNSGVRVTLTPAAASGSTFAGWTGACTNATGNCVVTMTAAKSVRATFNRVTSSCLSSMAAGTTVSGSWAAGCNATHRPGSYAKYYTFTLGTPQTVVINLTSATADSYLFLLSGNGMNGAAIAEDDDSGGSSNARITKALAAGTYTVEATTFYAATTGSFSLSVQASGGVNLVTNGGFENLGTGITMPPVGWYTYYAGNTFPGWQVNSGNVNIQTSAHGGVHSGSYALDLAGDAAGSISQTLPTVAGRQYTLELWYAASPYHPYSGPAQARVRWGGADIIGGLLSRDPTTATTNLMTRVPYVVTASSSTTTLSLVGLSPNGGIIVDDVSLIAR